MIDRLLSIKQAADMLGVNPKTLRRWESDKKITSKKTKGGHRRYLLSDINFLQGIEQKEEFSKSVAAYCRVSSNEQKQKGDLDRQKGRMLDYCVSKKYKVEHIFDEVGSGMSDKRTKL